jgi:hypothetical protein
MKLPIHHRWPLLLALLLCAASAGAADQSPPKYPSLPSETPAHFTPDHSSFGYTIRDVMIPMRDGVKLHTVIMLPKGAHDAPMLLTPASQTPSFGVMMKPQVANGNETDIQSGVQAWGGEPGQSPFLTRIGCLPTDQQRRVGRVGVWWEVGKRCHGQFLAARLRGGKPYAQ